MCGSSHKSVSAGMTVSVVWHPHKSVQANVCMSHAAVLQAYMYVLRHGTYTHLLALTHEGARPHSQSHLQLNGQPASGVQQALS